MSSIGQAKALALLARKASKAELQTLQADVAAQAEVLNGVSPDTLKDINTADFAKTVDDAFAEVVIQ